MLRKNKSLILIFILLMFTIINYHPNKLVTTKPVITVPDDAPTIQAAIDMASPGDTIQVKNGTYKEQVNVYKPLTLIGGLGGQTIIDGNNTGTVIKINASAVTINGFSVVNGLFGIAVYGSQNNIITNNTIYNNIIYGIILQSANATITNNTITNNGYGIILSNSRNNLLMNNRISSNTYNFGVQGETTSDFIQDIDASNTVNGKPIYYWVNKQNVLVPPDAGYVALASSTNITIKDVIVEKNLQGILITYSTNILMQNVTASKNQNAIEIKSSSYITIFDSKITDNAGIGVLISYSTRSKLRENTITNCGTYGVKLYFSDYINISTNNMINNAKIQIYDSDGGLIYRNNFINNKVESYYSINTWDNGVQGNYWSDYKGSDSNGDGIGDTPYIIDTDNKDNYPLMKPYIPGDANNDGRVSGADLAMLAYSWGSKIGDPNYLPQTDFNGDGLITGTDLAIMAKYWGYIA